MTKLGFYLVVAFDSEGGIGIGNSLPWHISQDMKFFKAVTCTKSLVDTLGDFGVKVTGANSIDLAPFQTHMNFQNPSNPQISREKITAPTSIEQFDNNSNLNSINQPIDAANIKHNAVIMGRKTWESLPAKFKPLPERMNMVLSNSSWESTLGEVWVNSLENALELAEKQGCPYVFVIGGGQIYRSAWKSEYCRGVIYTSIPTSFKCDTFLVDHEGNKIPEQLKNKGSRIESTLYREGNLEFNFNFVNF